MHRYAGGRVGLSWEGQPGWIDAQANSINPLANRPKAEDGWNEELACWRQSLKTPANGWNWGTKIEDEVNIKNWKQISNNYNFAIRWAIRFCGLSNWSWEPELELTCWRQSLKTTGNGWNEGTKIEDQVKVENRKQTWNSYNFAMRWAIRVLRWSNWSWEPEIELTCRKQSLKTPGNGCNWGTEIEDQVEVKNGKQTSNKYNFEMRWDISILR